MTSHPYTCLCCALAFTTPQTQRTHYTTDLHRYNSKRAVAGLTPVDITTFNQKFNKEEQQQQQQQQPASDSYHCQPCHKSFSSLAAHNNHLLSKKHQLNLAKPSPIQNHKVEEPNQDTPITHNKANLQQLIEQRIQQAPKIQPNECLFCPRSVSLRFPDPEHALKHMLSAHGFFLPDQEYLVDKLGLLAYMAEVVAVWNVCLYCGIGFGGKILSEHAPHDHASLTRKGLESVRKHMCDKNHCKLAWDTEEQRLEYSDFFDYRASYKANSSKSLKSKTKANRISSIVEEDEWEDVGSNSGSDVSMAEDLLPVDSREAVLGDSPFELVLPNGVRLGHRSLRYIYKQNLLPYAVGSQSTQAGNRNIKLLTRLAVLSSVEGVPPSLAAAVATPTQTSSALASRLAGRPGAKLASSLSNASLIPSRGGGINFNSRGSKTNPTDLVIKARNPGEAKMAGHHIRTFKDVHKRQLFQTRVACTSGNNQKHYRDPLLQ